MEEIKRLIEQQGQVYADFRKDCDKRLAEIEAKGSADALLTEKVDAQAKDMADLQGRIEALERKNARPHDGFADAPPDVRRREYKEAFLRYITKMDASGLEELRRKDVQVGVGQDGGYAVPVELDQTVLKLMKEANPMRQVCGQITIGGVEYRKVVDLGGTASGWVGETEARPKTDTPKLAVLTPVIGELYAKPASTETALEDIYFDVEKWLTESIADEFAAQENRVFMSGNGTNEPKGILTYPSAAQPDATRPFETLELVSAATPGTLAGDDLITLIYKLKAGHRQNARWMMNRATLAEVMKLKDGSERYLWQPSLELGQPSTLIGYPVVENEAMPDMGGTGAPIIFGDFGRAYLIVDRVGITVRRNPYQQEPFVYFYARKRVGGMLQDSEALKLLSV